MSKNKKGVILNISSDLGVIAPNQKIYKGLNFKKPVTYSVVKHGLIGLTKYTASYWGDKNVRCNAIAPGGIYNNQNISFIKKIKELIPLGRMARVDEYNGLVLFLCSDLSSYITGSTIIVDGGRSIIWIKKFLILQLFDWDDIERLKTLIRYELYKLSEDIPGDIFECGVLKELVIFW